MEGSPVFYRMIVVFVMNRVSGKKAGKAALKFFQRGFRNQHGTDEKQSTGKEPVTGKRKKLARAASVLACVVAFTTTYALILPAVTLESQPACGQEEHIHTDACYAYLDASGAVVDPAEAASLPVAGDFDTDTENAEMATTASATDTPQLLRRVLICGKEEHRHSVECYPSRSGTSSPDSTKKTSPKSVLTGLVGYDHSQSVTVDGTTITAEYNEGVLPDGVTMQAIPVSADAYVGAVADAVGKENTEIKTFDITFLSGDQEIEPSGKVKITFQADFIDPATDPAIVHITDDGSADLMDTKIANDTITLKTDSFSVYAISYTVDFHWDVDGKTYDFSIPGGGFVSLTDLVEVLGIVDSDGSGSSDVTLDAESAENDSGKDTAEVQEASEADAAVERSDVAIREAAKKFVAEIESVEFSDPELLSVSKVEEDTTAGAIKDAPGLVCEYSAELTEEQIAEINAQTVEAGDWALISRKAFDTEENLTVTMKDGEQFVVSVTDAQIRKTFITASGESYEITLTCGEESRIPDNAELSVREILAGTEEYTSYLRGAADNLNLKDGEISFARFFDIEILDQSGSKIEPKAHVEVKIDYAEPVEIAVNSTLNIVHFGEEKTEIISDVALSDDGGKITYTQDSFSVTGTIVSNPGQNNKYMLLVKQDDAYYIINNDGTLTKTEYENGEVSVDDPMLWTYQDNHLYFNSQASSFSSRKVAVDFYYRYLNPNAASGLAEDNVGEGSSVTTRWNNYIPSIMEGGDQIIGRDLWDSTGVQYTGGKIKGSKSNNYVGVSNDNGKLRIVGQKSQSDAAEIIFAKISKAESRIGAAYHTVDHIDISISGASHVSMPLDPGTYYYKDGSGKLTAFTLEDSKIVDLENSNVSVTTEDMKRARITAYKKDSNGNKTMLDDVFYITGYSSNKKTDSGNSPDQVRIEGSFKVANLNPVDVNQRHSTTTRDDRLSNKIYYNVLAEKSVDFDLRDLEHGQLYDADGKPLKVTVDVSLSADFNYWDEENSCPGIKEMDPYYPGGDIVGKWRKGDIFDNGLAYGGSDIGGALSGMDFEIEGTFRSTMITVIKVDQDTKTPVSGAFFTMTQIQDDGNPVDGGYAKGPLEVNDKGKLTFTGLTRGRYLLEESVVPAGYASPQQQWYITVDESGHTSLDNVTVEHSLITESSENVYTVENKVTSEHAPEGLESNVENHKRIDALRDGISNPDSSHIGNLTDLYRLYLDYRINTVQEENGVDLLFVIDHSGSMNNNAWQGNKHRAPSVKAALNGETGVIAEFLSMSSKNQWAAVDFAGPSGVSYVLNPNFRSSNAGQNDSSLISSWSRNQANIALENQGANMLTDYIAGFWRAEQLLTDQSVKNDGRKKVIVFISDGIPTLHIPGLNGSLSGAGTATGSQYYPDGNGGCPEETLTEFSYFVNDMKNIGYTFGMDMEFYTIGFGSAINDGNGIGNALLRNMIAAAYGDQEHAGNFMTLNDVNGSASYSDTAANTLKDYLRTITGLKETYDHIVISDDLSKYVDLYGLDADTEQTPVQILTSAGAKVTMTDPSDSTKTITLYENGRISTAEAARFTDTDGNEKSILQSVAYDGSIKTVAATFDPSYKAEPGITYTLSFDVKVTDEAYTEYMQTGYTVDEAGKVTIGDPDTDFKGTNPANSTSSGKDGFHSNDSAQVSYKHNNKDDHRDYPYPVVQVFKAPIQLVKIDQTGKALAGAKFDLYKDAYDTSGTEAARAVNARNRIKTNLTSMIKGSIPNQVAEIAIEELRPGTYYLVETEAPEGYILIDPIKIVVSVITEIENGNTRDTVTLVASQGEQEMTNFLTRPDAEDGKWVLKIQNNAGVALPNTGGSGTRRICLCGSILTGFACAGLVWIRRKKRNTI